MLFYPGGIQENSRGLSVSDYPRWAFQPGWAHAGGVLESSAATGPGTPPACPSLGEGRIRGNAYAFPPAIVRNPFGVGRALTHNRRRLIARISLIVSRTRR
jgi:hypothetical protein